jgi:pyruvate formate lyase activating enzyme
VAKKQSTASRGKPRDKRHVLHGVVHIQSTFNNTIVTVTVQQGEVLSWENSNTIAEQLIRACEIGREAGLNYTYAGNLPGRVGRGENTHCPSCDTLLVERFGYLIRQVNVTSDGQCPKCATKIPGIWK